MRKVEITMWLFNNLTAGDLETVLNFSRAMKDGSADREVVRTNRKQPPLND
jgi:hypothetical protein